jgi:hypothetical protein
MGVTGMIAIKNGTMMMAVLRIMDSGSTCVNEAFDEY